MMNVLGEVGGKVCAKCQRNVSVVVHVSVESAMLQVTI